MPRGRTSLFVLFFVFALVALALYVVIKGGELPLLKRKPVIKLPVDLQNVVPQTWRPLEEQFETCDFDGDDEEEWLLIYEYDEGKAPASLPGSGELARSLIGGVVYDTQVNQAPQEPGNAIPYRPASIFPYKLLPDYYSGKGQGYLGETKVSVVLHKLPQTNPDDLLCRADEIAIFGFAGDGWATRVSVFGWQNKTTGYGGGHFAGNARVKAIYESEEVDRISEVITYNRLQNHRSALCEVRKYSRDAPGTPRFSEDDAGYTIDFCFGTPTDPFHPEGVVIAYLRGGHPTAIDTTLPPTHNGYLMPDSDVTPALETSVKDDNSKLRVLSVSNEGAVRVQRAEGKLCPFPATGTPGNPANQWWCGAERATVLTEIMWDEQVREVTWQLISVANEQRTANVFWRIEGGQLR